MIAHSLFRGGLGHLKQRYGRKDGKPTWAVVTGASDGIGLAFCKQLAGLGFNVLLHGRNRAKLEEAEKEVKKMNPKIDTALIV